MAKKKEKRGDGGTSSFWGIRGTIVVIPEPKGEFRNVFEDVIEQMQERTRQNPNSRCTMREKERCDG